MPLIAYHSIQKENFYLIDQKIKSLYPFLLTRDVIFEKGRCIASKLLKKKLKPFRNFFGDAKDGVRADAINAFLVTPFNTPAKIYQDKDDKMNYNFFSILVEKKFVFTDFFETNPDPIQKKTLMKSKY